MKTLILYFFAGAGIASFLWLLSPPRTDPLIRMIAIVLVSGFVTWSLT